MDAVEFREYCLTKPKATEGTPFGETVLVFKVAGKMFALMSLDEVPATVNLKCDPDLALELRDLKLLRLHPPVPGERFLPIVRQRFHPIAQLRRMHLRSCDACA